MWIIIIVVVLVFGYFVHGMIANKTRKPDVPQRQISNDGLEFHEIPEEAEIRRRHIAAYEYYGKISDLIKERKYPAALRLIEKTLTNEDFDQDNDFYAKDIVRCFVRLAEDMSPQEVLNYYDELKSCGKAVDYAERHGHLNDFASTFADRVINFCEVENKADLEEAIKLINTEHPLAEHALKIDVDAYAIFLDDQCKEVFHDWEEREQSDTIDVIIPRIRKRLIS